MTATATETKKTVLTPASFKYVMFLFDEGADKDYIPVGPDVDSNLFSELQKKGVLERKGAKKGRGGSRGEVHLLIHKDSVTEGNSRAPRGSKGTSGPRAPRSNMTAVSTTVLQIPKSALPLKHAEVIRYIDATNGNSQREFEKRKQEGLTSDEVSKAIKGLRGRELITKMRELEEAIDQTFEQHLHTLGFPTEFISILGIPEAGVDTPDEPPSVQAALSNGKMAAPKAAVRKR